MFCVKKEGITPPVSILEYFYPLQHHNSIVFPCCTPVFIFYEISSLLLEIHCSSSVLCCCCYGTENGSSSSFFFFLLLFL